MFLCFLSGLMVGNMKAIVAEKVPWLNNINPVAVISDSFYCLNIYENYDRYITKMITMAIITVIFISLGIISSRRKTYASI
jgi:ABC-2 type transport system permease protein